MGLRFWKEHPALQESPKLLAALEKADRCDAPSEDVHTELVGMWEKKGDVFSIAAASFPEQKPSAVLGLELYSEKSGLLLQTDYLDKKDLYTLEGISRFASATAEGTQKTFRQEAHFMWLEPDGAVRTADRTLRFDVHPEAIAEATNVTAPRAKNHQTTIVLYGREPASGEIEDYKYPDNKKSGNYVKAMLPVSGEVIFNSEYKINRVLLEEPYVPVLQFILSSGQEPVYYQKDYAKAFTIDGNHLKFQFEEDWGATIDVHRFNVSTTLNLYLNFKVEVESASFPYTLNIVVTSLTDLYDAGTPTTAIIEPISIRWGCLARGTGITMADGSVRPIESICSGDLVRTPNGPKQVAEVLTGMEETLCCLKTESGKMLYATCDHPVMTAEGLKRMDRLQGDDLIMSGDGRAEPLCALYTITYQDLVYNLVLEGGEAETMIANGLLTGENVSQNTLQDKETASWGADVLALKQEMENLAGRLKAEP